jgi:alanyl-tRNA synthetase
VTSGEAYALLHARAREAEELREELERARREAKKAVRSESGPEFVSYETDASGGVQVIVAHVASTSADALLELSDREKQRAQPAAVVLGSTEDGTVHLVANFDHSLEERGLNAAEVIREAAALVGGGGGGRPTMARAGGKNPEKLPEALETAKQRILAALR